MTSQITNRIYLDGKEVGFAAVKGDGFNIPKDFGIKTLSCSTGCGRGYYANYEIYNNEIFIKEFTFKREMDISLPTINGVEPILYTRENRHELQGMGFNTEYKELHLKMPFTGTLWLLKNPKVASYVPIDATPETL